MANWMDIYKGGGFYTLDQLGNKTLTGEIVTCEPVERTIKKSTATKLEITLDVDDKPIILNQDSCKALAKAFGNDYDDWIGQKVRVAKGKVAFGKGSVPAIVVSPLSNPKRK